MFFLEQCRGDQAIARAPAPVKVRVKAGGARGVVWRRVIAAAVASAVIGSAGGTGISVTAAIAAPAPAAAPTFTFELDDLAGPDWSARKVQVALTAGGGASLKAAAVSALGHSFRDVALVCERFVLDSAQVRCEGGRVQAVRAAAGTAAGTAPAWLADFTFETRSKRLHLTLMPAPNERWVLELAGSDVRLQLEDADLMRIAPLLAPRQGSGIMPAAGLVSGDIRYGPARVVANLRFSGAGFADAAGLHAGEKLSGSVALDAVHAASGWNWSGTLAWDEGAVFWDPVYIASGGHRLDARGQINDAQIEVQAATLDWRGLGRLTGRFTWERAAARLQRYAIEGGGLTLAGLRDFVPQAWAEQNQLTGLRLSGQADVQLEGSAGSAGSAGGVERAALRLRDAGIGAPQRALALDKLNTDFRYAASGSAPFSLSLQALRIRDLTLGPVETEGEMRDGRLRIPNLLIPVLDGVLALAEIEIGKDAAQLQGALTAVPMEKLTTALGWHPLGGELSFVLPRVTYRQSTLSMDGALLFKVFGGDAQVDGIRLDGPFGRTPRLSAGLHLKRLNLEEMTRAVKFGNITGYLDVDVDDLVMENWQPLSMNAKVLTSAGDFRKRISQGAVQNISSIGGAGAGAAIQRSFLRFFDTFGYDKIGISCKLRNGICEMGGADTASGGYTLIKGGGLPAVNVVGYNRFVGWQELLERIKAVIDGNSKPIVQ